VQHGFCTGAARGLHGHARFVLSGEIVPSFDGEFLKMGPTMSAPFCLGEIAASGTPQSAANLLTHLRRLVRVGDELLSRHRVHLSPSRIFGTARPAPMTGVNTPEEKFGGAYLFHSKLRTHAEFLRCG
jgi:hypothetical protein